MNRKNIFALFILAVAFSTLAMAALAADSETGMIGALLTPFGRLEQVYMKFDTIIDAGIYLIIFLGLTQFTLGNKFKAEKGGKAIVVGVSITLALGLALFERTANFNIASFGPVAALVLIALMGYAVWSGIKSMDVGADNLTMAAIAYVLVYFSMQAVTPNVIIWLNEHVAIVGALLALLAIAFTILLIVKIVKFLISLFGGGTPGPVPPGPNPPGPGPNPPGPNPPGPAPPEPDDELKAIMSFLHKAMDKLNEILEGTDVFEKAVRHWGSEWDRNQSRDHANQNAKTAVAVLQKSVGEPYDEAKSLVMEAITQARKVMHTSKYSAEIKQAVEQKRHEIEAVYAKLGKIGADRIPGCTGVLMTYINQKAKKTPKFLQHTIINSHLKYLRGDIGVVHASVGAIWKGVRDLIDKMKAAASRGVAFVNP